MKNWVLASFNPDKVKEILALMPEVFSIQILGSFPNAIEPVENGLTLEENAEIKSLYASQFTGLPALADDTGLSVDALGGSPGVLSARYAGEPSNSIANIRKLLDALDVHENRKAHFETVICLSGISTGTVFLKGKLHGSIAREPIGTGGFGYDSVFIPDGSSRSLAEYSKEEKNSISHRGLAIQAFLQWLKQNAIS
jgi:XTP/dITP diphosphohydrolase